MKTIFTLQNIHDFLLQKGYPEWNYEVYDRYLGHIKKAKIEDFIDRVGFIEHKTYTLSNTLLERSIISKCPFEIGSNDPG